MAVNWALGLQQGNAGDAFASAFKQGQETNRQNMARSAMAALAQDPNNERAYQALAQADPQTAMQFRQQRLEMAKQQMGQHYDAMMKGAELVRQMQPKDDASWQQVLQTAAQIGIPLDGVPQHFDPNYVHQLVSVADAFQPAHDQDPGIIREFDIATQRGLVPQGTTYQQYVQMRNPGMSSPVTIPENATVSLPGQSGVPKVTDQASYDAIPPGGQYMDPDGHIRTKGGQSPQGSGNFQ